MSNIQENAPLAVIKVGGDILFHEVEKNGLARNISSLIDAGWKVCILHGGGQQTSDLQQKYSLEPRKIAGRRITSKEDLNMVKMALCGQVNVDLVSVLQAHNINAFGCHGASGRIIQAKKRPPRVFSGAGDKPIDFGEVGDVTGINSGLIKVLIDNNQVPVIASLGISETGDIYNINADTTVMAMAKALSADLLLLTTGVGAVYTDIQDPTSRISEIDKSTFKQLIEKKIITDGMIPKVEEALSLLDFGVGAISITSASTDGAFLSIAKDELKYGTRITLSI